MKNLFHDTLTFFGELLQPVRDFVHNLIFEDTRSWYNRNPGFGEVFLAVMRLLLLILMLLMFILIGGDAFQQVSARQTAIQARAISPLLHLIPLDWITFVIYIFTWENLRYIFPVVGAIVSILLAGAYYVKDIYNLKNMTDGLRYVISSLFAIGYPHVNIDHGEMELNPKETNLIQAVGGPGHAMIQPGNAVLFRKLHQVSRNIITSSVLMTRFETIGTITNLDDQDGFIDEVNVVTRDGIKVVVRDVRYRYRILPEMLNGKPVPRSEVNPYPFSREAFIDMSYALSVNESGQASWAGAVRGPIIGVIESYINAHTIDYLTAPRSHRRDPRVEMRMAMFGPELVNPLKRLGTQLLWVDIGHFDIVAPEVDLMRIRQWAADSIGDAQIQQAYVEARRMSYQEQGRAEGQAELLVGITQALENVSLADNKGQNVRQVMLARVAQILEAMHDNNLPAGGKGI